MRLLRTEGPDLKPETFLSARLAPPYVCLSHRWGHDEVTFHDLQAPNFKPESKDQERSWNKIINSRRAARNLGYGYIWIDTVCIDQKSSAELTEAINSMYSWYEQAAYCIAYLADDRGTKNSFRLSDWWSRGWTLQELIAPKELLFYDNTWSPRVTRYHAAPVIEQLTGVSRILLESPSRHALREICAATIFSWAAKRETTKDEDKAYCLFGLFNVQLPILYGEGIQNALWRLQMEAYRSTSDHSIFAWDFTHEMSRRDKVQSLVTTSLSRFEPLHGVRLVSYSSLKLGFHWAEPVTRMYSEIAHGLRVQFLMLRTGPGRGPPHLGLLILPCVCTREGEVFVILIQAQVNEHGAVTRSPRAAEYIKPADLSELIKGHQLLLIDTFLPPSGHDLRSLPDPNRSSGQYTRAKVQISDSAVVGADGLGLQLSGTHDHSTQPWYAFESANPGISWSYFAEFEGSLHITVDSRDIGLGITAAVNRWRSIDMYRPTPDLSSNLNQPSHHTSTERLWLRSEPRVISLPWVDGRIISITVHRTHPSAQQDSDERLDWVVILGIEISQEPPEDLEHCLASSSSGLQPG